MADTRIEPASRQVIENKLLARLDDADTAAVMLTAEDLALLVQALRRLPCYGPKKRMQANRLAGDLNALREAAFSDWRKS